MKNDGKKVEIEQRTMGVTIRKERAKSIVNRKTSIIREEAEGVGEKR